MSHNKNLIDAILPLFLYRGKYSAGKWFILTTQKTYCRSHKCHKGNGDVREVGEFEEMVYT